MSTFWSIAITSLVSPAVLLLLDKGWEWHKTRKATKPIFTVRPMVLELDTTGWLRLEIFYKSGPELSVFRPTVHLRPKGEKRHPKSNNYTVWANYPEIDPEDMYTSTSVHPISKYPDPWTPGTLRQFELRIEGWEAINQVDRRKGFAFLSLGNGHDIWQTVNLDAPMLRIFKHIEESKALEARWAAKENQPDGEQSPPG